MNVQSKQFLNNFFTGGVKRMQSTCDYVGLGKSKIYELISKGEFPSPISLGTPKAKGFLVSELDEWIAQQASKRTSASNKQGIK